MGEIADMQLDGALCECCGVFLGDAVGYPRRCKECGADESWHGAVVGKEGEEITRETFTKRKRVVVKEV